MAAVRLSLQGSHFADIDAASSTRHISGLEDKCVESIGANQADPIWTSWPQQPGNSVGKGVST